MITPFTITSLDQGREFACRQVERLHVQSASPVPVNEIRATEPAMPKPRARRDAQPSMVAQFLAFWNSSLPIGVWRL